MSDCFVYVVCRSLDDGFSGPVKVGVANDPGRRVATLQTACPFKIELVATFAAPTREIAMGLERAFHEVQRPSRLYGEWFDMHPTKAIILMVENLRAMLGSLELPEELVTKIMEWSPQADARLAP